MKFRASNAGEHFDRSDPNLSSSLSIADLIYLYELEQIRGNSRDSRVYWRVRKDAVYATYVYETVRYKVN